MNEFQTQVKNLLEEHSIDFRTEECGDIMLCSSATCAIVTVDVSAESAEQAIEQNKRLETLIDRKDGNVMILAEDRWRSSEEVYAKRVLAHFGMFRRLFARNCEVRRIDAEEAAVFLKKYHSYGDAACRYRYGLFLKKSSAGFSEGDLLAVAEFSSPRKWQKSGIEIRSYEWTRFASAADVRVNGGMGKMLGRFVADVHPDDVMSYADLEWSDGGAYRKMGFAYEGKRDSVLFEIDLRDWSRKAAFSLSEYTCGAEIKDGKYSGGRYFVNLGSAKYRLKLTDYEQ